MSRNRISMAVALAGLVLVTAPAFANGGDFFEEFAANLMTKDPNEGPSYFGFVRDARGRAIPNATVSATIKTTGSGMNVMSDVVGYYKIPGFSKTIDPKTVDITCGKQGFRQVARDRRVQPTPHAPIEVTCTLAPTGRQS